MNVVRLALVAALLMATQVASAADENNYFPRVERIKIHLAKGGGGSVEAVSLWDAALYSRAKDDPDPKAYDFLVEYGVTNRKTTSSAIDDKTVRVVTRGEFADIFQLIRIVDSSRPFQLRSNQAVDLKWDGKVLALRLASLDDDKPRTADVPGIVCEITTDGRFTENSVGEISEDRSTIIIKEEKDFRIEIEELDEST